MTRRTASVLGAMTLALAAAPAAHAATATIDGSPLNITVSDIGSIQITRDGATIGEFTPQPAQPAYAGFTASLRRTPTGPLTGFSYTAGGGFLFTPASPAPTVTGDGQTTPFILTANFDAVAGGVPFAHIAEQIVYANGSSTVEVAYSITNTTTDGSTLSGRFFESADLNVGGNGSGIGTFTATPIRQVGGVNPTNGRTATLFEVTPWTHYQEDANSTIQNIVNSNLATPPNLADTINPNPVDNGVAVQWDLASLAPGDNTGEGVVWNFGNTTAQPPPPVPGKAVNVNVVSGQVLLKVPGGQFVPLTGATQIPVGSQLDTTKGRVKLTSAATKAGKTQASDFYDGIFQVKQSVPKTPGALTTDVVLKRQASRALCSVRSVDKKKGPKTVLGKLWGNGKGKFRTSGKFASATVRGTIWLTQDECDGTLIRVKRGTVQVRDLRRHKTVTVRAGHSYLARAKK
jgi:hypothetical protein